MTEPSKHAREAAIAITSWGVLYTEDIDIVQNEVQKAIDSATAELRSEVERLRDAILRACAGERLLYIDVVRDLVISQGCGGRTIQSFCEPNDFECDHGYEWDCDSCPVCQDKNGEATDEKD